MRGLTHFLYQQRSRDTELSARLTLLEVPNLIAALLWIQDKDEPEEVVAWAISVEKILAQLGRPQALAQATRVREQAAGRLGEWSHARFLTESANIDRAAGTRRSAISLRGRPTNPSRMSGGRRRSSCVCGS